ncbi:Sodium:neurotransmitter symporter family protein [Anatilimnocola aggregata]|uniref:Sodium:neurotransmitter symporter family protein n=1 Tax=Anatilimnocola aggregata TaxID=2528021 RepID=A0A517Y7R8_9BACT|nr:sodium:calcium symporter [Anatilimnocola aggregata]QDU26284.1 Sodium:neurotransmitter symporter family protein [Anatilimnocola aggregata]
MAKKERWASRLGLVLAMAGNAVGLGNFLRFPAQAAANGGGAFLIPYLVALLVMGVPLIWVEWAMGRYGGQFGHHSTPGIFDSIGRRPYWKYIGVFGLWSNLIIAAFYLYIESWTLAYAGYSLLGGFETTSAGAFFDRITGNFPNSIWAFSVPGLVMFALCIIINIFILSRGLAAGIELVSKIGMPLLIVFAIIIAIRGLLIVPGVEPITDQARAAAGFGIIDPQAVASPFEGLRFLWEPKFDSLANPAVWLAAAGQIFFTLSIGMGSIHCYASYLREQDDIALTGSTAAWTNEFCEVILGGSILLPIAVAYLGLSQVQEMTAGGSGFGIGFMTFPTLFQKWGVLAPVAGFLWFGLLFFAAITSSLAMGQPIMSFFQTEFGLSRSKSALAFGAMLLPFAAPVAFLAQGSFFDEFDYWAGTFALVVLATAEAVLFAWIFGMDRAWAEIGKGAEMRVPRPFYYIIKYVTPTFLILILVAYTFQPAGRMEVTDGVTLQKKLVEKGWTPYITGWFGKEPIPKWEWSPSGMIGKLLYRDLALQKQDLQLQLMAVGITPEQHQATRDKIDFLPKLQMLRQLDRGAMIFAFLFFCGLVWYAWRKRAAATDTLPAKSTGSKPAAKEPKR